jgi:hypothetical protein
MPGSEKSGATDPIGRDADVPRPQAARDTANKVQMTSRIEIR